MASCLSEEERQALTWAMFEDVTEAAAGVTQCEAIVIVSSYAPAIHRARLLGFDVIVEEHQFSESESVDSASAALAAKGFDAVMRLPADVPLVRSDDIDELLTRELSAPAALLVASREGTGTNAIIRTPPTVFPSRFGPNSLALHTKEAAKAGAQCLVANYPRLALDIDDASDLAAFLESGERTRTFHALSKMNAASRLPELGKTAQ